MSVGLTRALHIAMTPAEREAAHELRMTFMRNVQQLSLSPTGQSADHRPAAPGDVGGKTCAARPKPTR